MALVNLPPIYLKVRRFDIDVPGQANRSDWTGSRQGVGQPGADTWYANAAFLPAATETDKRLLRVFLYSMRGSVNWFRLPRSPGQHPGPNPTVAAVVDEFTITLSSAAGILPGMWATFTTGAKTRLVNILATNVGGNVNRISFEPLLRTDPAVASTVEIMNPFCEMVLSNPRNGFDTDEGVDTLEFDAEEA